MSERVYVYLQLPGRRRVPLAAVHALGSERPRTSARSALVRDFEESMRGAQDAVAGPDIVKSSPHQMAC